MPDARASASVDQKLRAFIDAASSCCNDRVIFYKTLEREGPEQAYRVFSNRVGINQLWLPEIRKRLNVSENYT